MISLTGRQVETIKATAETLITNELAGNKRLLSEKNTQLNELQDKKLALEEKWIHDQISRDTYDRWSGNYDNQIISLKMEIQKLDKDHSPAFKILTKHLHLLKDLRSVFMRADTLQKRQFLEQGFDSNLYYEKGVYRTPTMIEFLSHNHLKMREKGLLIYEKKGDFLAKIPAGGAGGIRTLVQTWYKVSFLHA